MASQCLEFFADQTVDLVSDPKGFSALQTGRLVTLFVNGDYDGAVVDAFVTHKTNPGAVGGGDWTVLRDIHDIDLLFGPGQPTVKFQGNAFANIQVKATLMVMRLQNAGPTTNLTAVVFS